MTVEPGNKFQPTADHLGGGGAFQSIGVQPVPQQPVSGTAPTHRLTDAYAQAEPGQLDLRRQMQTIRRHYLWVLIMALISACAAAFVGYRRQSPWRYQVRAILRRESLGQASQNLYALLSDELIESSIGDGAKDAGLPGDVKKLKVTIEGMRGVLITAEGHDPEVTRKQAEGVVPAFNAWFAKKLYDETDGLRKRKTALESELVEASGKLQDALRARRYLEAVEARYKDEQLKLETLEAKLRELEATAGETDPVESGATPDAAVVLKRHKLVSEIVDLEMQQTDMQGRYTQSHPRLKAITARLNLLRKELATLPTPSAARPGEGHALRMEALDSRARQGVLEKHLAKAKTESQEKSADEVRLRMREAVLSQDILSLSKSLSRMESLGLAPPLRQVDDDVGEIRPPSKTANVLGAIPFGLLLGLAMGVFFALAPGNERK